MSPTPDASLKPESQDLQLLAIEPWSPAPGTGTPTHFRLKFSLKKGGTAVTEECKLGYRDTRFMCPCAYCVDEHTGKRTLTLEKVPLEIKATGVSRVGRYAVSIAWSDGHKTGIYSYETLYQLCQTAN